MAVSFTVTRLTTRFHDSNGNGVLDPGETNLDSGEIGVYDPGDYLYTRIKITNTGNEPATGVTISDNFAGSTISGSLNISPIAFNDSFTAVGNTVLRVGTAGQEALGANGNPSGNPSLIFNGNVLSNDHGSSIVGTGALADDGIQGFQVRPATGASAQGGSFTIFADGSFTYVNQAGDTGVDTFTYTIQDAGLDGNYATTGDNLTSTATVSITLTGEVWYVDASAGSNGTGTSANPFNSITNLNAANKDGAGDTIYVEGTNAVPATGAIVLEADQKLIGTGADLIVAGFTLATAGTNSHISSSGTNGYTVTVATNNTIAGLNIVGTGTNTGGITDTQGGSFGTLSLNPAALNPATSGYQSTINSTGAAISLSDGAIAGNGFSSITSTGGANNVSLTNITGTLNLGGGSMTGATGASFNVSGGSVSSTYSGTLGHSEATGSLLNVAGGHTGTLTLNGTNTSTNGGGLVFNNADGTYTVAGTTTIDGGTSGIAITNGSAGGFTFGGTMNIGQTTSVAGVSVTVADSDADVNFNADVKQTTNFAILDITNHSAAGSFIAQTTASFNASNGTGLQFSNADGTYEMFSVNTLNGGDAGIDIDTGSGGSFEFNLNTSITNPSGDAFVVDDSTATVTFGGSITDNSGRVVFIDNHDSANNITFTTTSSITATAGSSGIVIQESGTGGTIAFNGETQLATTNQTAITLTNNTGKTIHFNADGAGLDITTTSGSGIVASNGGTIRVSDVGSGNSINVSNGGASAVAFSATNTTIAAGGVTFDTINQTNGANGIVLNNTGSGSFTILGTGAANSGGTIDNVTGAGISLTNTGAINLTRMLIQNGDDDGIFGSGVNGFTLTNSSVLNNGNGSLEHGIQLGTGIGAGVTGTLLLDTVTVRGSYEHNFSLNNQSGTLNTLNIKNSTFDHNSVPSVGGGNGVLIVTGGTAVITDASITNSVFRKNFSNGLLVNVEGNSRIGANDATAASTDGFIVYDNDFYDNNIAIQFGVFESADLTVDIHLNTILNENRRGFSEPASTGTAIVVGSSAIAAAGSTLNARIDDNTIGNNNIAGSGSSIGNGIRVIVQGLTDATVLITNNDVFETPSGRGIEAHFLGHQNDLTPVPTSDITVTNNVVDHTNLQFNPGGGGSDAPLQAILITGDNQATALGAPTVRADVRNNNVPSSSANGVGFTNNWLEVIEYPTGNISVLDTGAPNATADAQLKANNVGVVGANPEVGLITGSINLPPDLSPLPMNAEAPPPAPPVIDEESVHTPPADSPPADSGPAPAPGSTPTPASAGPVVVDDGVLSRAELDFMVEAAIQRWAAAGATDEQIAAMRAVQVSVSDMGGLLLGESGAGTIRVDSDAAGWRWFVDSTPGDDSEYSGTGSKLAAVDPNGQAGTRIDLLTVLTHELGHQIGLSDLSAPGDSDELMYGTIGAGQRRLPGSDDLDGAAAGPVTGAYAFAPVSLGTIPVGQTVIVEFRHVIDGVGEDRLVGAWTGQSFVDSDQTDPELSNGESGNVDGLTLGDLIFNDVNKNGVFDIGDTALAGVVLTLFADTNNDGDYDEGVDLHIGYTDVNGVPGYQQGIDTPANPGSGTPLTATTNGFGLYTFSNLAPGDYIVRVDASNFVSGGALFGKTSSLGVKNPNDTNADGDSGTVTPADVNVNNDDNGEQFLIGQAGTYAASRAIRLDFGQETQAGPTGPALDTNNSLDLAFFAPNAAPVLGALNGDTGTFTENGSAVFLDTGTNATVTDADSANLAGGNLSITWAAQTGDNVGFGNGVTLDGSNNVSVGATNVGTATFAPGSVSIQLNSNANAANIQTLIRNLQFDSIGETPVAGTRTFTITLVDGDGNDGGLGNDTGTASTTITVVPVSDAPEGANRTGTGLYDSTGPAYAFTVADFATGFTDPNDSPANTFAGVKITTLPSASAGTIYFDSNLADATPAVAIAAGDSFTAQDLTDGKLTFVGAAGSAGTPMSFTFQVIDNGSTANGGVIMDGSPATFSTTIVASNAAPVLDLDANDSSTPSTVGGFKSSYTEGAAAAAIADTDVSITDADSTDDIVSATITITNPETGDQLVVGTLPASVTHDVPNSTATIVKLTAAPGTSRADFEAALKAITFQSSVDDPTDKGTNLSRLVSVVVNDGTANSNTATATIGVTDVNDAPAGTSKTITAVEDAHRTLSAGDFGIVDADGTLGSVEISAVTGGGIYYDADGAGNASTPQLSTLPVTFTEQDLANGRVSFKADPNANGTAVATITFTVADDDGAVASGSNLLTVDVTAQNDTPVLTTPSPVAATEQTAVALLPAGSVVDVDLDALNNGNGDYKGAQFSVNRNSSASTDDVFTLVAGPNFTIDGIDLKTTGGQIFATISANNPGLLVINFTSSQAIATSALVDEVIQAVRYTNVNDNPPASVDLAVGLTDGSPGNGQGGGAALGLDVNLVTVNITGTNDAPVLDLNGAAAGSNATLAFTEGNGITPIAPDATVSDVDSADFATGTLVVDLTKVGTGDYITILAGNGITIDPGTQKVFFNSVEIATYAITNLSGTYTFTFNAAATAAAVQAVVRQVSFANTNDNQLSGDRTVTYTLSDGDGGTATAVTATVSVTAVDDPAVAQDDSVSTPENVVGTGSLFNNASGPDSDVDGGSFSVTQITVGAQNYAPGTEIVLSSGAKLIVNADGTYSYDPNGKFVTLTDGTSGAVNTSTIGDTFTYTVTGGDSATVTVTVTGVAGLGDELKGNGADNTINGTEDGDLFLVHQGGEDTTNGLGGDDRFYFGAALSSGDVINGGDGALDQLGLQGNYGTFGAGATPFTLGANHLVNIEMLVLLSGADSRFGDTAGNSYGYNLATLDANVAAGGQLLISFNTLGVGEKVTFDGSAETNGSFLTYGGLGTDNLTGGQQSDGFYFGADGRFGSGDRVDGQGGSLDQLGLQGDYSGVRAVTFAANSMTGIEMIVLLGAGDNRFGGGSGDGYSYDIVMNDANVAQGATMYISANTLRSDGTLTETLDFDGSAETDGAFIIYAGSGSDTVVGGAGADEIWGRGGSDTITGGLGADILRGGEGDDIFDYNDVGESALASVDSILDFTSGSDKIDLSGIDADSLAGGDQAFTFIGSNAFTGSGAASAGQLRAYQDGANWFVEGDTNGDGNADLVIQVTFTGIPIVQSDFIL